MKWDILTFFYIRSTLLRRFAKQCIPGVPLHLRVVYLQQEIPCSVESEMSVYSYLMKQMLSDGPSVEGSDFADSALNKEGMLQKLREEESRLETLLLQITSSGADEDQIESVSNQLCEIGDRIDALSSLPDCPSVDSSLPVEGNEESTEMAAVVSSWVSKH